MNRRPASHDRPGRVRIIAGHLRGSKLDVLDSPGLRPTPDRVRETLFNWLAPIIEGARCLDLYAGTGALGIEAASRGAREVVLVERDAAVARVIAGNLARLKVESARLVAAPAETFLRGAATPFDVVFVDPPYAAGAWSGACTALAESGWLAKGAYVQLESPKGQDPAVPADWTLWRELHAGNARCAVYRARA